MQEVALQLEFLIVVDAVEDVRCDLEKLLNESLVGEFAGVVVDLLDHFVVALECLALELLVGVDLIAFCLEDPAERLGIHVVDVALAEFEGIAVVLEDFVVVDL